VRGTTVMENGKVVGLQGHGKYISRNLAMRIWYQSLFDGGRLPAYFEGLPRARWRAKA
jgi:hypothetical protein